MLFRSKFFDIWEDFRTPFSFVPAVPLLSAYQRSATIVSCMSIKSGKAAFSTDCEIPIPVGVGISMVCPTGFEPATAGCW